MDVDVSKWESHDMIQLEIQARELNKRWMASKGELIILWGLGWKNQLSEYESWSVVWGLKRIRLRRVGLSNDWILIFLKFF